MRSGQLRHQVVIKAATRTTDAGGGAAVAWNAISDGTVFASIVPTESPETWSGDQLEGRVTHKVTIRYLSGVATGQRVVFGSRWFDVRAIVNPQERNRMLILLCEERSSVS